MIIRICRNRRALGPVRTLVRPRALAAGLLLAAACGMGASAAAQVEPARLAPPATLDYAVQARMRGMPFSTEAQLQWQHDSRRYTANWTVQLPLVGARRQESVGIVNGQGLVPERYTERTRRERSAVLDHAAGRVKFSGDRPAARLEPGVQDRLSISLQLGALLAAAPQRYPAGSTIVRQTVGVSKAEPWRWRVVGEEALRVDGRSLPCIKLEREPRAGRSSDKRIEIWLAPSLSWLPARLRVTEDDRNVVEQTLRTLPALPAG